jgi:hypothetical protein
MAPTFEGLVRKGAPVSSGSPFSLTGEQNVSGPLKGPIASALTISARLTPRLVPRGMCLRAPYRLVQMQRRRASRPHFVLQAHARLLAPACSSPARALRGGGLAQARSSAIVPLAPVPVETKPISEQARTERTQSEHAQPAPDPAATTWSQRLRSRG